MPIPDGVKLNFETLRRAFEQRDVGLLECVDRTTGAPAYVVCAVQRDEEEGGGDAFTFVPFAVMDHELIDKLLPPTDVHNSMGEHA